MRHSRRFVLKPYIRKVVSFGSVSTLAQRCSKSDGLLGSCRPQSPASHRIPRDNSTSLGRRLPSTTKERPTPGKASRVQSPCHSRGKVGLVTLSRGPPRERAPVAVRCRWTMGMFALCASTIGRRPSSTRVATERRATHAGSGWCSRLDELTGCGTGGHQECPTAVSKTFSSICGLCCSLLACMESVAASGAA